MRTSLRLPLTAVLLLAVGLAVGACRDPKFLSDEAACPGQTCTKDAQEMYDAIADIDGVTRVVRVERTYGFDHGASASAEVAARVGSKSGASQVAVAVLRELDGWPGHASSTAVATVAADPPTPVEQRETRAQSLEAAFYDPCSPVDCRAGVRHLTSVLRARLDVADLVVSARGDVLSIRARADGAPAGQLASAAMDLVESDLHVRVADRVVVRIDFTGPLVVSLRLDDGLVCEQPAGQIVRCEEDDSQPLDPA